MRVATYSCADISHVSAFPLPELDLKGRGNRPPLPHIRRERTFNEPDDLKVRTGFLIAACCKRSNANRIEHLPPVVLSRSPIEKTLENPVAVNHRFGKSLPCSLSLAETLLNDRGLVADHANSCRTALSFQRGDEFSEKRIKTPLGVEHVHDGESMRLVLFHKPLQAFVCMGNQLLLNFSSFKSLHPEPREFTAFEACEAEVLCSRSNGERPDRGNRQHESVVDRRIGEATASVRNPTFARFVRATLTSSSRLRTGA